MTQWEEPEEDAPAGQSAVSNVSETSSPRGREVRPVEFSRSDDLAALKLLRKEADAKLNNLRYLFF